MNTKNLREYTMRKASYKGRRRRPGAVRRCVCGVLAFLTLIALLFVVDGLTHGITPFKTGAILMLIGIILFAGLIWAAGALNPEG